MSKKTKGGLGRGLDSLLGGDTPMLDEAPAPAVAPAPVETPAAPPAAGAEEGIREIALNLLQAGRLPAAYANGRIRRCRNWPTRFTSMACCNRW